MGTQALAGRIQGFKVVGLGSGSSGVQSVGFAVLGFRVRWFGHCSDSSGFGLVCLGGMVAPPEVFKV